MLVLLWSLPLTTIVDSRTRADERALRIEAGSFETPFEVIWGEVGQEEARAAANRRSREAVTARSTASASSSVVVVVMVYSSSVVSSTELGARRSFMAVESKVNLGTLGGRPISVEDAESKSLNLL